MAKERLVLVDGSAMIYRAYFAYPAHFSTKSGLHTNASFGFVRMFHKLLSGRTPDRCAVVFDAPGRTFREEKYAEYKAHRPRMDPELREQLPWIDRLVDAHNFVRLRVPGFEADDVIGTLTRMATEAGMEVIIVSGDKDFVQLLGDDVRMLDAVKDVTYDPELAFKKWGAKPEHFVDLLAMMGDKSDNIPGVPGIGQKGAAKLIDKYGSLEEILAHTDELKGRQKQNLEDYEDAARLSKELATIDRTVPLDVTLDDLAHEAPDQKALNEVYKELEFFSFLGEEARDDQSKAEHGDAEYLLVTAPEEITERLASLADAAVIALLPLYVLPSSISGRWCGVAISGEAASAFYVPLVGDEASVSSRIEALRPLLEDEARPKVGHNIKELWQACKNQGIELRGVVGDTALASFLIDPTGLIPHNLDQLVKEYLHRTIRPLKSLTGSGQKEVSIDEVSIEEAAEFAGHWADPIFQLWQLLEPRLKKDGQYDQLMEIDLPLAFVLGQMELDGIKVDEQELEKMGEEFRERLEAYKQKIYALAGREFNVASTKQLSKVLFEELELPVIKRTKTGYSTNQEVLERLAPKHEIAQHLLAQRKLSKLINTYTDVLQREVNPVTQRIHATFQQTVGATGRLISTEPDLQRTPVRTPEGQRIRECFIAEGDNQIISGDWSQIELRVLAHLSRDPILVEAFQQGLDIHLRTASEIFDCEMDAVSKEQRDVAKTINFATIYGQGATALGQILGIPRKEAASYIEGYFETYAGVRVWLDQTIDRAHEDGFVTTLFGRRRYIPELSANNYIDRAAGERIAANTPIQGSAADLCKLAMLQIHTALEEEGLETKMLLQIHDELVFEAPKEEAERAAELVRERMEDVYPLDVPLVSNVGIGPSWGKAH